jgi:hypothetical protein
MRRSWGGLLRLYADNEDMDILYLARHFNPTKRAVVIALTCLILEPQGQLEDRNCPKWEQRWTQQDVDEVHDTFRTGGSLQSICRCRGRDQLSVAYRLLADQLPDAYVALEEFHDA